MIRRMTEKQLNDALDNIGAALGTLDVLDLVLKHHPPIFLVPEIAEARRKQKRIIAREQARVEFLSGGDR